MTGLQTLLRSCKEGDPAVKNDYDGAELPQDKESKHKHHGYLALRMAGQGGLRSAHAEKDPIPAGPPAMVGCVPVWSGLL